MNEQNMDAIGFISALLKFISGAVANPWLTGIISLLVISLGVFGYWWVTRKIDRAQRDAAQRNSERQHKEVIEREVIENEQKNDIDNANRTKLDDL